VSKKNPLQKRAGRMVQAVRVPAEQVQGPVPPKNKNKNKMYDINNKRQNIFHTRK
jgi:hypothetical protein